MNLQIMTAEEFLEEIDYYNTNVEGQLYEELGIETLADMLEVYYQRKLKLLGISDVVVPKGALCDGLCKFEATINAKEECVRCGLIHKE